jgi:hypothetical protein
VELLFKTSRQILNFVQQSRILGGHHRTFVASQRDASAMRIKIVTTTYCLAIGTATIAWVWMFVDFAKWLIGI